MPTSVLSLTNPNQFFQKCIRLLSGQLRLIAMEKESVHPIKQV
jgi:hypothetical protein